MRIGVDLDDVLAVSMPHYLQALNRRFNLSIEPEEGAWRILDRFPEVSRREANSFFTELIEGGFFLSRPLMQGAKEAVESLVEDGHRLFVVTGRATKDAAATRAWLQQVGLFHHLGAVVHNGTERVDRYKAATASELQLDLFIEDEPAVATAIAEAAIPVLLFDHPWNRGVVHPNVQRIHSWPEAMSLIADLNG